ncbi:hypothetical protein PFMALIP_02041 [Plasmodium falciparum MaliPS096_E11]|uniref:Uncharacterized protein n=3 Tax=Plasmodium falciparum TaxID=5833 RepID=A0A024WTN3_PLAFA|nr:hypothetical protein PFMALIP_02041 [Plasmodium falciparum MaliPS096_E11]
MDIGDNFITVPMNIYKFIIKNKFFYVYFTDYYNTNIFVNKNLYYINQNKKYMWLSITEALTEAKQYCRLPYGTGSAGVMYGLPI